ncbi:hypothetical protein BJV74DRAFT_981662 [Russula compacta]|nr:hypothetical protein BJV74DRAFT_981662 [Russula compacta]
MLPAPSSAPVDVSSESIFLTGPLFIGSITSWLLLGILTMQLYVYYVSFPTDRGWIKFTVYGLYLLDLVQSVLITEVAWVVLCPGWGKSTSLVYTSWGFSLTPVVSGLISGWVQIFFAWRVWALGHSTFWRVVTMVIFAIALTQAGSAIAAGIKFAHINNIERISAVNLLVSIWLAGSALADVLIAASMLYFLVLAKRNTMWNNGRSTNRRITKLIRCTVETGVLSAAAASLDLGLFLGYNHNNLHAAVAMVLSKLYSNALMASLHSRGGVYERTVSSALYDAERSAGCFNTVQFTSVGVAVTVDDSGTASTATELDKA